MRESKTTFYCQFISNYISCIILSINVIPEQIDSRTIVFYKVIEIFNKKCQFNGKMTKEDVIVFSSSISYLYEFSKAEMTVILYPFVHLASFTVWSIFLEEFDWRLLYFKVLSIFFQKHVTLSALWHVKTMHIILHNMILHITFYIILYILLWNTSYSGPQSNVNLITW